MQHDEVVFTSGCDFDEHGHLGILRSDVCTSKCTVDNIPKQLVKGDSAVLVVTTRDSLGNQVVPKQPVKAKIRKPHASWEDIDVMDNKDGTHKVTVFGQVNGKYQVTMIVGDQQMPGCPLVIPVIGLVKTIGSEGSYMGQYNRPFCVAINKNGDIVTADTFNNRLQMITRDGILKKILKFSQFKMPFTPFDIALCSDNTYYSLDNNNRRVVVSDEDGHIIRIFGRHQLNDPRGIAISPLNGTVYVTEDDRVMIYSKHGKYLSSFGTPEFFEPLGVAIGSTGMIFFTDHSNNCIHVFNVYNKYLYSFDCKSTAGELLCPMGITIENDKYLYVTASSTCPYTADGFILKFETCGKFVCRIDNDSDGLNHPDGIALTNDVPCRVVVADTANHCIKVFVQ
ncbi:tripartite motif-containing protein 2-like [Ptychodera flava]|uniref:tripartite motif-containing protein 2-like n=1 Tax=Ptychodera flava TaxID=63121 RepID=UPI00396A3361